MGGRDLSMRRPTSSLSSLTFGFDPATARDSTLPGRLGRGASPQRTTLSGILRLAFPQLGRDLPERDKGEVARLLRRDTPLIGCLREPASGELLDDARGLAAVEVERRIEAAVVGCGRESLARTDLVGERT